MVNMSYCRFRNTANDLYDCMKHIGDDLHNENEKKARKELINLCQEILDEAEDCGLMDEEV
jgi:hypothetical protein